MAYEINKQFQFPIYRPIFSYFVEIDSSLFEEE